MITDHPALGADISRPVLSCVSTPCSHKGRRKRRAARRDVDRALLFEPWDDMTREVVDRRPNRTRDEIIADDDAAARQKCTWMGCLPCQPAVPRPIMALRGG